MGRPRKYPVGTTASEIARAATERLAANGGARKTFALSARALESMSMLRAAGDHASDTALIEALLEEARKRLP